MGIPVTEGGKVVRLEGIFQDITDRKKSETALKESEQRLRLFVDHAPAAIAMLDKNMKYIAVSRQWLSDYRISLKNITGLSHYEVFPDISIKWKEIHQRCLAGAVEKCSEDIFPRADGTTDWLRWEIHPWYEEKNEIGGLIIFSEVITERKKAEQALIEKTQLEKQISQIAITAPGALCSFKVTPDDKFLMPYVSPMWEELFSLKQKDVAEDFQAVFQRIHPEDVELVRNSIKKSAITLTDWLCEFRIINPHKGILWLEGHSNPTLQLDGSILWHGFITDITQRKIAEEALRESQEHLRLVVESSNDIFIMQDINGKYLYCSGSKNYGIIPSEIIGKYPDDFHQPEQANKINQRIKKVIAAGKTIVEDEVMNWNGEDVWFNTQVTPVLDVKGKVIAISTISRNITKQRRADENIRKLSLGIEQSPAIIMITDKNGNIEYVNPKFTKVTGYTFDEVKGKNPRFLKSGIQDLEQYKDLWSTILDKKEWGGEFLNRKKNGELYWESSLISPLLNEKGEIINFIAVKEDITALKKMNNELMAAKEKAEEMNRVKSYFFANISHELRTPFVGILGFSELLADILNEPEQKQMAESILTSSKRLTETLNKILDLSKLEFDQNEIHYANIDVNNLIENVNVLYSKLSDKQNTAVTVNVHPVPLVWKTDEKMLRAIVANLLHNAIKFTANGKISIDAFTRIEKQTQYLILKISDNGIGIPQNKHELIWQEFRQASEGYNRSFEGTGLGLTITKKYIDLLGGNIHLESEPGTGSIFIVKLPKIDEAFLNTYSLNKRVSETTAKQHKSANQKSILYIEDDFISIEFVKEILKKDYKISVADKPALALEMIMNNKYDTVLLDINLGYGMNGIELMSQIKKQENYKNTPIVAVTAYASSSDENEFISRGFSHYISKPFLSKELLNLLEKIFSAS